MNEVTGITYDICQRYIQDRRSTLSEDMFNLLHGKIRARDFQYLASVCNFSTLDVTSVEEARTLLQVEAFFKKNASFTDSQSSRLAALLSFEEGEELCEATNNRLDLHYAEHRETDDLRFKQVERCQDYIDMVLGDFSTFLEEIPRLVRVTNGATATRSRRSALPFLKVSKKVVCTPGAYPYLEALSDYYGYGSLGGRLITSNRVEFVPKSWKTERTIACEAEGNSILQLAFDSYAKKRLRRKGINLSDQTRNQELAKEGSIDGKLATIDLSMASDTLAYNTARLLLPEEWFAYLRAIRSQYYALYPNQREAYHKFSSMGNGATFALETLIFAACCYAVRSTTFSVYGDDIIIERDKVADLFSLLAYLGFVPNSEKSHSDGPFRESCGKSWFRGFDITPRYIRSVDGRKATWCHLVNSMALISQPFGMLEEYLQSLVRTKKLPLIPFNEDSMSGVWITPTHAYSEKLIRTPKRGRFAWRPRVKAFVASSFTIRERSTRSLFLWYLGTLGREPSGQPRSFLAWREYVRHGKFRDDAYESSWNARSSHKFRRKWVHWYPVVGAPGHLYWWSENLIRRIKSTD